MQNYDSNNLDFNNNTQTDRTSILSSQLVRVFAWMFVGLIITGITSLLVLSSETMLTALFSGGVLFVFIILELILVFFISSRAMHMNYAAAALSFILYSVINGVTLSVVFAMYTASSICLAFFMVAGFFGFMCLYGALTKSDLTSLGSMLTMGLIGLIIASVINMFLGSSTIYWITSLAGVVIFLGLTAYDTQKINHLSLQYAGTEKERNIAIVGALILYLDFVNLLLYVLRFLGKRRR